MNLMSKHATACADIIKQLDFTPDKRFQHLDFEQINKKFQSLQQNQPAQTILQLIVNFERFVRLPLAGPGTMKRPIVTPNKRFQHLDFEQIDKKIQPLQQIQPPSPGPASITFVPCFPFHPFPQCNALPPLISGNPPPLRDCGSQ